MKTLTTFFLLCLVSCSLYAQNIFYVRTDGNDGNSGISNTSTGAKATLASAVTAASAGDIIQLAPGSYSGTGFNNINLGSKYLRIIGSGSGSNPATSTIITGSGVGNTFMIPAKGSSSSNRMEVSNIYLSGFSTFFNSVDSNSSFYNLSIKGDSAYSQFVWRIANNASGINIERCTISDIWFWDAANSNFKYSASNAGQVIRSDNSNNLYNLNIRQCSFDRSFIGIYIAQGSAPSSKTDANEITITNCSFTNMGIKAFYAERLDNLVIENCSFDNVGQLTSSHPAAIDINLKWNVFNGNINIKYCYFNGCGIPNSGSDGNGAAVLFKARDFGSYSSVPATFSGTFTINGCIFKNNNAGIRFGESNSGSGNGAGENSHTSLATFTIKNSILQNNNGTSNLTHNRFAIRNVTTGAVNVSNCYFGGSAATTNTTFSGPVDVSNVNSGNGGSVNITGTLNTGEIIRLNASEVYQSDYTTLASALSGASDGNIIIVPPATVSGTTTVNNNITLISPGAGRLYTSHLTSFNNLTVNSSKTLTLGSDCQVTGMLSVSAGNGLTLGKYVTLDLAGSLTAGGTFTGAITSSVPNSEVLLSGSGNITIPTFINGLSVLNVNRGVADVISLGANLTIGHVQFTNSTVNLNGFKLTVTGATLNNTSTINGIASGSELEIAGSSRTFQLNGGTFHNLTVNRNQGTQLSGDLIINNTLTLSNGSLFLDNFNCTLESTATINGTPDASKMIIATGSGQLRKKFTTAGSFIFPVGDDQGTFEYSPVSLNFTSGTFGSGAMASVNLSNVKHPSNNSTSHFISRYWSVNQTNISGFSCSVTCTYTNADIAGTESAMISGKFSSGTWVNMGGINAASNLVQGTVNSFSDFTAGEGVALPVSWLSIAATAVSPTDVLIKWSTASELHTVCFTPQVSTDGINFTSAGNCKEAAGFSWQPKSYEYVHQNAFNGSANVLYYRIEELDAQGKYSYSSIVPVAFDAITERIRVFPNPLNGSIINLTLPIGEQPETIQMFDTKGINVLRESSVWRNATSEGIALNLPPNLKAGVYILVIHTPSNSYSTKVVK